MQIKRVFALLLLAGAMVPSLLEPSLLAQVQRVEMRVEGMT